MTDASAPHEDGDSLDAAERRRAVRERYADIATESSAACCDDGCSDDPAVGGTTSRGYAADDLAAVDGDANLGLGCGNPTAIAGLEPGETVLDLGSGGGFDCFLAAREVGADGRVIGVDMTPAMVEKARENRAANDATTVEFRLGEIEHLPVADASVDVILSNCVINLSAEKARVFREAYRVLRPGGRLAISDVVQTAELPADLRADPDSIAACVGGAATIESLESMLEAAGFTGISIEPKADSATFIREWDDDRDLSEYLVAATIEAEKPPSAPSSGRQPTSNADTNR
ncbi:arsenite methyltransferase [Halovivax limisalsi]|uniref:arsenite methyltransferase n=1 Tax=Halovivax limisalsi TaxID=1453760 RepID=UPI001FFDDFDC|nr:arsenite methyltransferase [Halovivax limisalsi]